MDTSQLPLSKGRTRKSLKAKKDRAEATMKTSVRAQVFQRDQGCRLLAGFEWYSQPYNGGPFVTTFTGPFQVHECVGDPEWAHMHVKRRSQTRGQAPEIRHTTKDSLMLCRFHHQEYDAHRLKITALSRRGADGPLKFSRRK